MGELPLSSPPSLLGLPTKGGPTLVHKLKKYIIYVLTIYTAFMMMFHKAFLHHFLLQPTNKATTDDAARGMLFIILANNKWYGVGACVCPG